MKKNFAILAVLIPLVLFTCIEFLINKNKEKRIDNCGLHDYQLYYHLDTLKIFDKGRLVGTHINTNDTAYEHGKFIDSLIMADNL